MKASEMLLQGERAHKPKQQLSTVWLDIGFEDAYAIQTLVEQRKLREGRLASNVVFRQRPKRGFVTWLTNDI